MNRHYDNYLVRKYPLLYRDRHGDMRTTAMVWGFSCGDGWFNILDTLSAKLSYPYEEAKWRLDWLLENKPSEIEAIKEQQLRISELEENHPRAVQVKEKFGSLRFYVDGIVRPDHRAAIAFAESLSVRTCEVCGARGKQRGGGWIRTLCNTHAMESKQRSDDESSD